MNNPVVLESFLVQNGIFIAYSALFLMALIPIYFGSLSGLKKEKVQEGEEFFSMDDAKMFPIIGSATLFSLYLIFRFLNKDYVNMVLTAYFCFLGIGALIQTALGILRSITGKELIGEYKLNIFKKSKEIVSFNFGYLDIGLFIISCIISALYAATKHWMLTDAYGLAFASSAIKLLKLDSFSTGMLLLAGLFLYDIFWVFGTDVMVTVAKSFDAPIKVVFPKNLLDPTSFTMLGLGDIVIPGIYVALSLQFDYAQAIKRGSKGLNFPKPYFWASFFAYCVGLITTVAVMHSFNSAQPALLYLSPACIFSTLLTAYFRGEIKDIFAFSANPKEEEVTRGDGPAASAGKRGKKIN